MASVSIIIPAHNEAKDLPNLLHSIRREVAFDVDIMVVDNGSSDDTSAVAIELGCRVTRTNEKLFPSAARNLGAQHCRSSVLVFLDADVIVTPSWGRELERLASDPAFVDGNVIMGESCHISSNPAWIERYWFEPLRRRGRWFVNGANMILPRRLFEKTGGFNAELETGKDVEFSEKAIALGMEVRLNSELAVHHEGFPKNLRAFFRREKWHGMGDFSSFAYFRKSKVARLVAVISCCYVALLSIVPLMMYGATTLAATLLAACVLVIAGVCAASSLAKFARVGAVYTLVGVFIYFVYFNARLASMLQTWRNIDWFGAEADFEVDESELSARSRNG